MQNNSIDIYPIIDCLLEKQKDYLTQLDRYDTQLVRKIAEISVLTKELSAKREIVNVYFSNRLQEKEDMYNLANKVLEKAIETGDVGMADLAIKQIQIINSIKI